ncbi:Protein FAR1-RELATED SEQUENCE 11 [Artemisia annua]|uniref:Protein FAR1-RELATED SEQUENCE 11 n=1 Tax=Artemisia annua TaxID=35608 RepID=A0A2U1PXY9_ARTAN|nr:Protein FAR1-RELATED SEQUENCE 11 [Artemisia annua]
MKLLPFNLNEVPSEENIVDENIDEKENIDEPFVGQCFLSEEEVFVFYMKYARMKGFSVRKGRFKNKNGVKKVRDFFCHRQGKPETKVADYSKQQRSRGSTRCECKAYMRIKLKRINEIFPEEWQVTKFVTEQNHVLLSTLYLYSIPWAFLAHFLFQDAPARPKKKMWVFIKPGTVLCLSQLTFIGGPHIGVSYPHRVIYLFHFLVRKAKKPSVVLIRVLLEFRGFINFGFFDDSFAGSFAVAEIFKTQIAAIKVPVTKPINGLPFKSLVTSNLNTKVLSTEKHISDNDCVAAGSDTNVHDEARPELGKEFGREGSQGGEQAPEAEYEEVKKQNHRGTIFSSALVTGTPVTDVACQFNKKNQLPDCYSSNGFRDRRVREARMRYRGCTNGFRIKADLGYQQSPKNEITPLVTLFTIDDVSRNSPAYRSIYRHSIMVVNFYAPWCCWSDRLLLIHLCLTSHDPEIDGRMIMGKVECTEFSLDPFTPE